MISVDEDDTPELLSRPFPGQRFREVGTSADSWMVERRLAGKSFDVMRFRLFFHGSLPPSGNKKTRASEKWVVRRDIHPQLEQLRTSHPVFSGFGLQMPHRPATLNVNALAALWPLPPCQMWPKKL
jgi:hypothetical protein